MAILAGNAASAIEVNKIFLKSSILNFANFDKHRKEILQNLDTASLDANYLDQSFLADGGDFLWDGFGRDETMDVTNSTLVADNEDTLDNLIVTNNQFISRRAYICKVLDQFNDSSVDANIWSTTGTSGTGSVTEDTEKVIINAPIGSGPTNKAVLISDGAGGLDLKSFAGDSEIILHIIQDSAVAIDNLIQISNGSTHVNIKEFGNNTTSRHTYRIVIDKSAEEAYISEDGNAFGGAIDISSATTNWYLRFFAEGDSSSSSRMWVFFVGFVDGNASTVDYVSATKTFDNTKSAGIATWDTNSSLTIDGFLSADGGSNYSAATKDTWTTIANTGTTAKIKLTCTIPTSIVGSPVVANIPHIKAVGGYFDG